MQFTAKELLNAARQRHSVRDYLDRPLADGVVAALQLEIDRCNSDGELNIQMLTEEPTAFSGLLARYGRFSGVRNYLAMVGAKRDDLDERVGYYGQQIVLSAQALGLNSCWVGLTYSKAKSKAIVADGERLVCVVALGYGATSGAPHKSKPMKDLCSVRGDLPDWFQSGMEAAMLAPTAVNQQKFLMTLAGNAVFAQVTGGFYGRVDLGIVKYHFELGAGPDTFRWA